MFGLNNKAAISIGCLILAAALLTPLSARADEWNLTTRFTVNQSFQVPGMSLQADTPYVIRLLDSPSTRNVVQIYNADQTQMLTMFMAISDERPAPADRTVFTFIETEPGFPLPMKEWFYPGRQLGLEFVYPKEQAQEIASHAQEPVLSASVGDLHDLNTISVEAIGPAGEKTSVAENAVERAKPESEVYESVTKAAPPEPDADQVAPVEKPKSDALDLSAQNNQEQSKLQEQTRLQNPLTTEAQPGIEAQPQTEPRPSVADNGELPRTAGETPLIALIGILCVAGGLALRVLPGANRERSEPQLNS